MVKIATTALIVLATASCASPAYGPASSSRVVGFSEGCASVNADLSRPPRVAYEGDYRYGNDSEYRRGWINGRNTCIATRILPPAG